MRDFTQEDRAMRAKFEGNSSAEQRVNMAATINGLAKVHDQRAMPGLQSYAMIRLLQSDRASAQAGEARRHNVSHEKWLRRAAASPAVAAADGSMRSDERTRRDKWSQGDVRAMTIEEMQTLVGLRSLYSRYF